MNWCIELRTSTLAIPLRSDCPYTEILHLVGYCCANSVAVHPVLLGLHPRIVHAMLGIICAGLSILAGHDVGRHERTKEVTSHVLCKNLEPSHSSTEVELVNSL